MSNGKVIIIFLTVGMITNTLLHKKELFSRGIPDKNKKKKVKLDLSNYATKSYLKNETGVDTLQFAKK